MMATERTLRAIRSHITHWAPKFVIRRWSHSVRFIAHSSSKHRPGSSPVENISHRIATPKPVTEEPRSARRHHEIRRTAVRILLNPGSTRELGGIFPQYGRERHSAISKLMRHQIVW